ncbi:MAG: dihydrolipoamide acetyltransferase family protein [Chloroflexota bacterium]|nr:dihydrolipoamide acetyltransferase family protein [Chloroflexota bacterium]
MATEVRLPHLGESIDSAVLVVWHKQVGDPIKRGDELADLETDKATLPLEAPKNGILLAILAGEGETVGIGDLLSVIGREGESWSPESESPEKPASAIPAVNTTVSIPVADEEPPAKIKISPVARRKARELGIDLASVAPADGLKISGADVEAHARQTARAGNATGGRRIELSQSKRLTGQRMLESAQNLPQFALTIDADARNLLKFREQAKSAGDNFSLTALLIRATAITLRDHPLLNASFENDGITVFDAINIGVATAAADGLRVPVIHEADKLSLTALNDKLGELAAKGRENRLSLAEMSGGTFTLSNLGMTGVSHFTPLVNPPQSAILGLGAARSLIIPGTDGGIEIARMMALTVACDHRVLDGMEAAAFLASLKRAVESFASEEQTC